MSPPGPEQVDAALAALTGTVSEAKPSSDLERNLVRLRLVAEAANRGVPWSRIGLVMGCSGKEAKRQMKQLARHTQRQLLLAKDR
jgi:hypothetical protein